ncbi:MAG: resuscitation-promoting factor [Candidatus Saccharimonadales bacterium]
MRKGIAQPRNLLAIGLLISIVSLGPASGRLPVSADASADSKALISLYADGQQHLFSADDRTVGDILRHEGIKLAAGDIVEPAAASVVPRGQFNINVYRARPVLVQDGLRTYRIKSAYQSPRLLALAAGLIVYPEDTYTVNVITDVVGNGAVGEKVIVDRAKPVNVNVDGKHVLIRTQAATAGAALAASSVVLGASDTVSVDKSAPVVPGMSITITRVTQALVTLTQSLPRPVQTIDDPQAMKGTVVVKDPGADGEKTVTWRVHYKDGVETGREAVQLVSETQPVTKVVVEGTKVIFAGSVEYWRPLVETAAAANGLDPNMMLRIMTCESHGNASIVSSFVINGEHPTGLFQFLPATWRANGGTDDNILDGTVQIKIAAKKMAREGTSAWQCK